MLTPGFLFGNLDHAYENMKFFHVSIYKLNCFFKFKVFFKCSTNMLKLKIVFERENKKKILNKSSLVCWLFEP